MIYFPNPNYYVEVKGNVAFVKEKKTHRTIGFWKDEQYTGYALNKDASIDVEGKAIETDEEK